MSVFEHKIIFTGPVGSGKSTAIQAYSGVAPVITDVRPTDMTLSMKDHTTVAMDYGMIQLDDETRVHLYGTPGQQRFDFMWDILSKGGMGLVILINHQAAQPQQDLRFYLNAFRELSQRAPVVIGITHCVGDTTKGEPDLAAYEAVVAEYGLDAPVLAVDVRREQDVRDLVLAVLFAVAI